MNNKNILIGGLLAIVLAMAIGYAAFATTLTVNGTANVTSTWNVGFDTTKTNALTATAGLAGATAPTGTIAFASEQSATLAATLRQPGDRIVFTLTVQNKGTLNATLGALSLTGTNCTVSGSTCTTASGNIKFTVSNPASTSLVASTGTTTFTITAEYPNNAVTSSGAETASLRVALNATQATS